MSETITVTGRCPTCSEPTDEQRPAPGEPSVHIECANCETPWDLEAPPYTTPSAEQIRESKAARERLRTEFGVDMGATWCPKCLLPAAEPQPTHEEDPKNVTCAHCQTTWTLPPLPAPPPPKPPTMVDRVAQTCKSPRVASHHASESLSRFVEGGTPHDLHLAIVYLARCCELLAHGQTNLARDVADLNVHAGDLDTKTDPIAPPPPGVERPAREPISTKSRARAVANAAKTLQPSS